MTFLKWYTFIMIFLSFLINLYKYGNNNDDIIGFIVILIMTLPMLVYLFLS